MAVTAVQMVAGALAAVQTAALEGLPAAPSRPRRLSWRCSRSRSPARWPPFALFAYGQSRVAPELAGAFLNLEPIVGTAAGALAFSDPFGPLQLAGGFVILVGIVLSTTPRRKPVIQRVRPSAPRDASHLHHARRRLVGHYVSSSTPSHSLPP